MAKILVVDDEEHIVMILKDSLEFSGFQVVTAYNGEEALEMVEKGRPDLIVLDIGMPKLDGWQVCRQLKADFRTKKIPIIMLTARSAQIEELRGWESGADDYLTKPCDYKVLLEKIESFLPKTKPVGTARSEEMLP